MRPAQASDGAVLASFTADVEFDVADDVGALKSVMGTNDPASYLTEAIRITVDDAVTGSNVNASDGAILAGFTADVEFNVEDTANAIAEQRYRFWIWCWWIR